MDHVDAQDCRVARDWSLSCILLLHPRPTVLCMYYCRCDNTSSRLSGVAYRTSKDLVTWSEPVMALVLPPSISPPTFNRCALEQKNVLSGESVRDEHCWGHVTCHMRRTQTAIPASITRPLSVAPASRRSCLRAVGLIICRYAPQAWSTTGRCCLQVRWWLGLGCNIL